MLRFYKRIVMFGLFVLIEANVDEGFVRKNREYQIYEKLDDDVANDSTGRPDWTVVPQTSSTASPNRTENEYGEFRIIQSNLLRITTPAYRIPLPDRGTVARKLRTSSSPLHDLVKVGNASLEIAASTKSVVDGVENRTLGVIGSPRYRGKHGGGGVKKKKKKHGFKVLKLIWHHMKKLMPKLSKMHGPAMFMLGMAQANFNNFVMHALMMSKMALISVFMMIIREVVFGDKENPVRYYNFGYEKHPYPQHHHYRRYGYYEPQVSDDYQQYDYKRRRKRQVDA